MAAPPHTVPAAPAPQVVLDEAGLSSVVSRLAAEVDRHHDDDTVVVCVLKGGLIVASDLLRRLTISPVVEFVAVSPFRPGTRAVLVTRPRAPLTDRRVLLVTDVVDSGLSLRFVLDQLGADRPRALTVCTLADKPHRRLVPVPVDHVGITTTADFLIGYGLDFAGRYRNLPVLAAADLDRLAADPGCYLDWAYGNRRPAGEAGDTRG